jgi:quercetin dioxygenase-like cupin family protein
MRWLAIFAAAAFGFSCAENKTGDSGASAPASAEHVVLRPGDLKWKDGTSLPPGAKFAVLEGDPTKEGFFAMRVMMPDGYQIPPHWHPGVERVTVISGTFHLGMGERFDRSAAQAMPAGTYSSMQPGMRHFAWTEGPTVVQIATLGPWGITYVNPGDDPRKK